MNSAEFYNKIYQDKPDKWSVPWRDKLAYYILSNHTQEPKTFLDIGCGNGHTIEYFIQKWPITTYYGIDLSDEAIRLAEKRVPEANFICTTYEDADVPLCDVAFLLGIAEHLEDLVPSLRKLKKFGKLIYLESPDCITAGLRNGSNNKDEGFRITHNGSGQKEWHLKQSTWEQKFRFAELEILQFYPGTHTFIWVLR